MDGLPFHVEVNLSGVGHAGAGRMVTDDLELGISWSPPCGVVILNVLAGRSPSDGAPVAVEYVPAHGTNGSAGTERWSR